MKNIRVISLLLPMLLILSACSINGTKNPVDTSRDNIPETAEMVKTLNELKVKYIGDNSKVNRLINNTGIKDMGGFTIALQTSEEPYGLTINFDEESDSDINYLSLEKDATKLIGLIENLGYVEITKDGKTTKYTEEAISEKLGFDVKELYYNPAKLEEFIEDNYEKATE